LIAFFHLCTYLQKRGRKPAIDSDTIFQVLEENKHDLFEDEKLKSNTHKIPHQLHERNIFSNVNYSTILLNQFSKLSIIAIETFFFKC